MDFAFQGTILLRHRDQPAIGLGTRRPACVGEQHQREQPRHLGIVGQQSMDDAGKPDGLGRELAAL